MQNFPIKTGRSQTREKRSETTNVIARTIIQAEADHSDALIASLRAARTEAEAHKPGFANDSRATQLRRQNTLTGAKPKLGATRNSRGR